MGTKNVACCEWKILPASSVAKTGRQSECPSADEWIKKMWYIYTMEYYSAVKKNEIRSFIATWMDMHHIN